MAGFRGSTISGSLWVAAIVVRLVAIAVLLFGPWTDEPTELQGWDAERFQEIIDRDGAAWVDEPVEYPPGTVLILDRLAGDGVVATHRALVVAAALTEVVGVAVLWRARGPTTARSFLFLGTPLIPMGYLRLDLMVTVVALLAALTLVVGWEPHRWRRRGWSAAFAVLVAVGTMIKIWPALLIAGAWGIGRRGAALTAAVATGAVAAVWLRVVGAGFGPVDDVLSLRGATGWHLESVPGALVALFGSAEPRPELNAFRIGTLDQTVVLGGRVVAVGVIAALAALAAVAGRADRPVGSDGGLSDLALVMLGSTAALIVTAPLLSPQFLLWLTPWGALASVDRPRRPALPALWTALILTGATLAIFGPDGLADPVPALLINLRNLALIAVVLSCLLELARDGAISRGRPRGTSAGAPGRHPRPLTS